MSWADEQFFPPFTSIAEAQRRRRCGLHRLRHGHPLGKLPPPRTKGAFPEGGLRRQQQCGVLSASVKRNLSGMQVTSKFDGRSRQLYYEAVFSWIRDSVRPNNDSAEEFGRIIFWFIWQKNFSGHNTLSAEMQKHPYFGRNELLSAERDLFRQRAINFYQ